MAERYTRRINLYMNGKEVNNDIKSIKAAMAQLTNQQAKMVIGSDEYVTAGKKIKQLKGILSEHNSSLQATQSLWQKTAGVVKKFLPVFSVGAMVAGVGKFISKMNEAVAAADNFEERLDNLSALTGLEGSELEQLGDIAKKTSVKITDGNVRIKQSADDIVDAYTKVGSQRPELLKNAEALASVTEDAIILSEAAKSDLEPAVAGLTTTMNQFNLGASESRRIINTLAAGSKAGSADIPYLTQAIEKSGTTLNLMNVSLEENIGLIETIAPYYSKAEMAGNSLDKVFLKMKASHIGYKDGVFSVDAALEELQTRFSNGETAAELFGVEHAKMGELLVKNKEDFNRYTKAVTGTNVAIEQASKNTNNAAAIQKQARNDFHNMSIELGQKLSPAMTSVYKAAGSLASAFTRLIETKGSEKLREDRIEMNNLFTAIKHTKEGTEERKKAIEELNQTYAKYLPNLLTEQSTLLEIEKTQRGANNELVKNIQLKLREEELEGLGRKQKDIMDNILGDVAKRKGKSLVPAAESEIFTLLDEMANMKSLDEAKDKLGAFAKVYRDASKNIGTYSENIQQFFELFQIGKDQQALLESINKISGTLNNPIPNPGKANTGGNSGTADPDGNSETSNSGEEPAKKEKEAAYKSLEIENIKKINIIKKHQLDVNESTEVFNKALEDEEIAALNRKLELQLKYGDDTTDTISAILEKQLQIQKDIQKQTEEEKKKSLKTELNNLDNQQKNELALIQKNALDESLSEEETNALLLAKELEFLNKKLELNQKYGEDITEIQAAIVENANATTANALKGDEERLKTFSDLKNKYATDEVLFKQGKDAAIAELDAAHKAGLIKSEEDYQRLKSEIVEKYESDRLNRASRYLNAGNEILSGAADFFATMKDAELAKAGDNAEKKAEIEKEYAGKQKALAIGMATISGAQAIIQLWAQPSVIPEPANSIYKGVMSAIIGATTIAQIAKIKSAKFAEGKYPDAEFVGKPKTGMYGSKPQLGIFNEVPGEPEMVIDGKTNRKISRDYPEIQEAIYAIRDGHEPGSINPANTKSNPIPNPMLYGLQSLRQKQNIGPSELAVKYFANGYYPVQNKTNSLVKKSGTETSTALGNDSQLVKDLLVAVNNLSKNVEYQAKNPPRPVVAVEMIEKGLKNYVEIQEKRGL